MKKILVVLMTLLLLGNVSVYASTNVKERTEDNSYGVRPGINVTSNKDEILATPYVDETEKIYDFADLFTPEEEKKLYDKVTNYIEKKNLDLVIVTINENNKDNTEDYAEDFYMYNNFGRDSKRSGSVFIIDMYNRDYDISSSGDAIKFMTDSIYNSIINDAEGYISNKRYYDGAVKVVEEMSKEQVTVKKNKINFGLCFVIANIIALICFLIEKSKYKGIKYATNASSYVDKKSIEDIKSEDKFINTSTTRTKINNESSSSKKTSVHTGNSGNTFSGGKGGKHF